MVHVLLLILKIILWVVLAVLGLALLIILSVLFLPVSYKADIECLDNPRVRAKVSFLVVSVSILYDKASSELNNVIRICGFKLGGRKKEKKPGAKHVNEEATDEINQFENQEPDSFENMEHNSYNDDLNMTIGDASSGIHSEENSKPDEHREKKGIKDDRISIDKEAADGKKADTVSKTDTLKKKINAFKEFWELECTTKTRGYLKKYFISVLKHVSPRKIKGYVTFGFDDSCTTGKVTGYLSLMPFVYKKGFSITPDFYNKILKCKVKIKGHFCLGYIMRIALNVNLWRTFKASKKYLS